MYYVISRSWFWNQNTYSFLNGTRLCRPEISLIMNRNSIDNSFLRQPPLYINIYTIFDNIAHGCHQQESFYFVALKSLYLNYIHSGPKLRPAISNNICSHFSYPYLDHVLHIFWLFNWLIYIFLLIFKFLPLTLKKRRCFNTP